MTSTTLHCHKMGIRNGMCRGGAIVNSTTLYLHKEEKQTKTKIGYDRGYLEGRCKCEEQCCQGQTAGVGDHGLLQSAGHSQSLQLVALGIHRPVPASQQHWPGYELLLEAVSEPCNQHYAPRQRQQHWIGLNGCLEQSQSHAITIMHRIRGNSMAVDNSNQFLLECNKDGRHCNEPLQKGDTA